MPGRTDKGLIGVVAQLVDKTLGDCSSVECDADAVLVLPFCFCHSWGATGLLQELYFLEFSNADLYQTVQHRVVIELARTIFNELHLLLLENADGEPS